MNTFKPSAIFFVRMAGGIKDATIGDVVAVTKVYCYECEKVEKDNMFCTRPEAPESTYDLIHRYRAIARNKKWLDRIAINDSYETWIDRVHGNKSYSPKAFVGPVVSGAKVIAETQSAIYEFILSSYNDALAVDMESLGFLQATPADKKLMSIVIRGVSDVLDGKFTSDIEGSHEVASINAAAFAFESFHSIIFNKK